LASGAGVSRFASTAFSSSLSGGSGDGNSLSSTITYALRVTGWPSEDRSAFVAVKPTSVLAVTIERTQTF
jgi:hypothetical protein